MRLLPSAHGAVGTRHPLLQPGGLLHAPFSFGPGGSSAGVNRPFGLPLVLYACLWSSRLRRMSCLCGARPRWPVQHARGALMVCVVADRFGSTLT